MGAIVLALTGAEALYADMGHFGTRPIRLAWTGLVLPSLALNYIGQGALLLRDPTALENPFYRLFPGAVAAAGGGAGHAGVGDRLAGRDLGRVLADQAGDPARPAAAHARALHVGRRRCGQIYMPSINWVLLVAVLLAVLGFGSSSALASAYGIAVTVTMLITTVLTFFVVRHGWGYPLPLALGCDGLFLLVDAVLVISCSLKFLQGGWFPLALGVVLFVVMATWRARPRAADRAHPQRRSGAAAVHRSRSPASRFRARARTAVYPVANPDTVPQALMHNLKHYQVLHERNVHRHRALSRGAVGAAGRTAAPSRRCRAGFWSVRVDYGFKDEPDMPMALGRCARFGLAVRPVPCVVLPQPRDRRPVRRGRHGAIGASRLFAAMSRNAGSVADYFQLPNNCVIELGTRVQL